MGTRATLALAAVMVASAAPAQARPQVTLPAMEQAALRYWGGGLPPCGVPTYQWTAPGVLTPQADNNLVTLADAAVTTCVIRFNVKTWPYLNNLERCVTVVHEIGHLFGHEHSEGGVMAATGVSYFPPCVRVLIEAWARS